jgi:hypothetical protein
MGKYQDVLSFMLLYIREAHTEDTWPNGNAFSEDSDACVWKQPTTDEERIDLAVRFLNKQYQHAELTLEHCPVAVEPVAGQFSDIFAPWPTRVYLFHVSAPTIESICLLDVGNIKDGQFSLEFIATHGDKLLAIDLLKYEDYEVKLDSSSGSS